MFKNVAKVTIGSGTAESGVIDMRDVVGDAGMVGVPSTWTAAAIGFKVCDTADGTFVPLRDEAGSVVQISGVQAAAAAFYKLPDALRGALFMKLWSQSGGVDANQAADRAMTIMAKG